jgi:hypothetical protein
MMANPVLPGRVEYAAYAEQFIEEFRDNPWIETLPDLPGPEEMKELMGVYPSRPADLEGRSITDRRLAAAGLQRYRHPVGVHVELATRLNNLLRWGYVDRNPLTPSFQAAINAREQALAISGTGESIMVSGGQVAGDYGTSATGLTLLGITGIGKTAMIDLWARLFPQLYIHTDYRGRAFMNTQVVYLRLQCPENGSIHALITNFFQAMDAVHRSVPLETNYDQAYLQSRKSVQELIPLMARVAAQHGLGLLILDEVQDLKPRGAGPILSFLVQLVNTIGVPVVMVGGLEALPILTEQFRQARRGTTEGDMIVGRAQAGREWWAFCEKLWSFQYTPETVPLTQEIAQTLLEESQGITHYVTHLHKLTQERAIATGRPYVTPALLRSVAKDSFNLARPVLGSMKRGDRAVLEWMEDVEVPAEYETIPFVRGDPSPAPPSTDVASAPPAEKSAPAKRASATARAAVPARPRAHGKVGVPAPRNVAHDTPLPDLLRRAQESGGTVSVYEMLKEEGLVGDELWEEITAE